MTKFRRLTCLALLSLLPACGYQPVLSTGTTDGNTTVAEALRGIEVATIEDRQGQVLRNHLIDRLHRQGAQPADQGTLKIRLSEQEVVLSRDKEDAATRAQMAVTANWQLVRGTEVRLKGNSRGIAGFNIPEAQFSARADEEDARARALEELAEDITTRLTLFLASDNQMPQ
ncbi:MAG: hypothetical protein Alpg2KO_10490 [Alphaproteobacteria bacterium]